MTFRYHSSRVRRVGCDGRKALLLLDRDDELYGIAGHGLTGQAPALGQLFIRKDAPVFGRDRQCPLDDADAALAAHALTAARQGQSRSLSLDIVMDPAASGAGNMHFLRRSSLALGAIRLRAGCTIVIHLEHSRVVA